MGPFESYTNIPQLSMMCQAVSYYNGHGMALRREGIMCSCIHLFIIVAVSYILISKYANDKNAVDNVHCKLECNTRFECRFSR